MLKGRPILQRVVVATLVCHALAIWALRQEPSQRKVQNTKRVAVKTVVYRPPSLKSVVKTRKVPPRKAAPSKTPKPVQKRRRPVKKVEKKVEKNKEADRRSELINRAKAELAQVNDSTPKKDFSVSKAPQKMDALSVEKEKEDEYYQELAGRLRHMLTLPEVGEVRVRLTLNRSGGVERLEILEYKSAKNAAFVEKMVPVLTFPAFGNHFSGEAKHEFLITLANETS